MGDILEVKKQVKIGGITINVPVKYKTQAITGFFPIATKKAVGFINNKRLKPAEISWGKSLVGITLFNHIECPVGPYKEIALSIPIFRDATLTIPMFSILLNNALKNFGFYSFLLTGSTDIGREHAEKIWGYPFYNKNIEVLLEDGASHFYISATEKTKQEKIFSMNVAKIKKEKNTKKYYQTYFFKNDKLIKVTISMAGFTVSSMRKNIGKLELGKHEISDILGNLEIDLTPIQTVYYGEATKIADIPEEV
jgi:hypothetical protein